MALVATMKVHALSIDHLFLLIVLPSNKYLPGVSKNMILYRISLRRFSHGIEKYIY